MNDILALRSFVSSYALLVPVVLLSISSVEAASVGTVPIAVAEPVSQQAGAAPSGNDISDVAAALQDSQSSPQAQAAPDPGDQSQPANPPEPSHKRIFGIIPNNRTAPTLANYQPLTAKEKFKIAWQDCFDRGTFMLGAAFGAEGQLTNSSPSFGTGVTAYLKYASASYADWAIGNLMTEGVYPAMLHEDPRYFRKGEGSYWSRLGYAVGQIFWTHTDSEGSQFNFSEVAGNATAVAISNAYYPDDRTLGHNVSKLFVQIGVDMAGNVLKEFSPDLTRKLSRKHHSGTP